MPTDRVLHIFGGLDVGGAETLIMNVYRAIDRGRLQFDFLVHTESEGHYEAEVRQMGGRVFRIPHPSKIGIARYCLGLYHILLREGPFIAIHCHVYWLSGLALMSAYLARIPVRIAHSHTTSDGKNGAFLWELYKALSRWLINTFATHRIGCSKAACKALFGKECAGTILRNGIPLNNYIRESRDGGIRRELGIAPETWIVGHVGRFVPQKNHVFVLDVFRGIHEQVPDTHLVLVGDGPLKDEIVHMVTKQGLSHCVHFLGIRHDIPRIMNDLDLLLLPSRYEGLGIVIIEAQAAAVPCIVSTSVPKEADVGLGLVHWLELGDMQLKEWISTGIKMLRDRFPRDTSRTIHELRARGWDIGDVASFLETIYSPSYISRLARMSGQGGA